MSRRKMPILTMVIVLLLIALIAACAAPATTSKAPTSSVPVTTTASVTPYQIVTPPTKTSPETTMTITRVDVPNPNNLKLGTDGMTLDQVNHKVYLANNKAPEVEVFDISTPKAVFVKSIITTSNCTGVLVVNGLKKLYATEDDGSVAVIDIDPASKTLNTIVGTINVGSAADGAEYIPGLNKIYANCGQKGYISVIDAATNTIAGKIDGLGTQLEPPTYNPNDKMVYSGSTSQNLLYKFDPKTDVLVSKTDIVDPCDPGHIAFKPGSNLGMIAAHHGSPQHTVVYDFSANRVVRVINDFGGGDGVIYDPVADLFMMGSSVFDPGSAIAFFDGNCNFLTYVKAGNKSNFAAFDQTNKLVYCVDLSTGHLTLNSFQLPNFTK